jgi:hypothetical protein
MVGQLPTLLLVEELQRTLHQVNGCAARESDLAIALTVAPPWMDVPTGK